MLLFRHQPSPSSYIGNYVRQLSSARTPSYNASLAKMTALTSADALNPSTASLADPLTPSADVLATSFSTKDALSAVSEKALGKRPAKPGMPEKRTTRSSGVSLPQSSSSRSRSDDGDPLLPAYTTLLFTLKPPSDLVLFEAPPLPVLLEALIEVPQCKLLDDTTMPLGRARRKPGQQADDSDEYYARKHAPGEGLERKARKQEKDRLIQERNTLRMKVEQLKLEVASSSYFANASPIKAASGRSSTPVISERAKENERLKKEQLREAEETLARYEEILEPRQPYSGITLLGSSVAPNGNGRKWIAGGKGVPAAPPASSTQFESTQAKSAVAGRPSATAAISAAMAKTRSSQSGSSVITPVSKVGAPLPNGQPIKRPVGRPPKHQAQQSIPPSLALASNAPLKPPFAYPRPTPVRFATAVPTHMQRASVLGPAELVGNPNVLADFDSEPEVLASGFIPYYRGNVRGNNGNTRRPAGVSNNLRGRAARAPVQSIPGGRKRKKKRKDSTDDDDDFNVEAAVFPDAKKEQEDEDSPLSEPDETHVLLIPSHRIEAEESQDERVDTENDLPARYKAKRHHKSNSISTQDSFWNYQGAGTGTGPKSPFAKGIKPAEASTSPARILPMTNGTDTAPLSSSDVAADVAAAALAVPTIPDLPSIQVTVAPGQEPAPLATAPAGASRFVRSSSTRSNTPSAILQQRRRAPRQHFRKPSISSIVPIQPGAHKQAVMAAALQRAESAFNSEGELSSVSSDNEPELPDSELKFRTERATRLLDKPDNVFPASLTAALTTANAAQKENHGAAMPETDLTSTAATAAKPAASAIARQRSRLAGSRAESVEPANEETVILPVSGLRVRKRPKLDEFPVNDLTEVADDYMIILRHTYENFSGRRPVTLGPGVAENPIGEWQIAINESYMRESIE